MLFSRQVDTILAGVGDSLTMNFRGLDMNLLVALNALLEEKNVTRTSQRIYLSQSATSEALSRLREFFDDELLVQKGNRMVLTPFAETLIKPVQEVLKRTQTIIDHDPEFHAEKSDRRFRLMMSEYVITILMPKVLRKLEEVAPHVELEIMPLCDKATELIDRSELDLLIMPEQFLSPDHPSQKLFSDTHTCIVSADNKAIGDSISATEYFAETHIAALYFNRRSSSLDRWLFSHANGKRKYAHICRSQALVPFLIVGTRHIATVHRHLAEAYTKCLPLRIVTPRFEMPSLVEMMQWSSVREEDAGVAWLRNCLEEIAKRELGGHQVTRSDKPLISAEFKTFLRDELP